MGKSGKLPWWTVVSSIACLAFVIIFVWQFPTTPSEWAAWLQAFGSITAVGSGVFLIHHQIQSKKSSEIEKENQDRIRLIKNLQTEIRVNWERLDRSWGDILSPKDEGAAGVNLIMNVKGWPFPIYDASARDLGMIESEATRDLFISVYAAARGFLLTMEINNELIFRVDRALRDFQQAQVLSPGLVAACEQALHSAVSDFNKYGANIKAKYEELRVLVQEMSKVEAV